MVSRGGSRHTALCVLTSFCQKQLELLQPVVASPTGAAAVVKLKAQISTLPISPASNTSALRTRCPPAPRQQEPWRRVESNVILRFIISSLYLIQTWQKLHQWSISFPLQLFPRWGAGRMNAARWSECDLRLSPVADGCITLMFYPLNGAESESRVALVFLCWYQSGSRCLRLGPQQLEVEFRTPRCPSLSPGAEPSAGSGRLQIHCKHWTMTFIETWASSCRCICERIPIICSADLLAAATTEPQKHLGTWWCAENCEKNETTWSQNFKLKSQFFKDGPSLFTSPFDSCRGNICLFNNKVIIIDHL